MNVKLIVDSTADLRACIKDTLPVIPLTVNFGDQEYTDGVTITHKEFYEKLATDPNHPTTSQATPDAFTQVFSKVNAAGDSAVVLTLSSKFSGTYQSAMIAAADFSDIYVVDSGTVAIGCGILVDLALQLIDQGMSAKEVAEELNRQKKDVRILATVDTLEYLKRGGRVSKTVAFAGGLLNMKPLISVVDGEIQSIGKARGSKQANAQLAAQIAQGNLDNTRPVLLGYTGVNDENLQNFIAQTHEQWDKGITPLESTIVGSVIGTHAGPGAVAIAYFAK